MRRFSTSFFIALVACLIMAMPAQAQKKYKLNTKHAVSQLIDSEGSVKVIISNTTKDTFSVRWILLDNSFGMTGWFYGYCDLNQCYTGALPTSGINKLDSFGPKAFHVDVYNAYNNRKASAYIKLKLYQLGYEKDADTMILEFKPLSSIGQQAALAAKVNIFPNPAENTLFLNIEGNAYKPVTANITNVLGQNIAISPAMLQAGKIDLGTLQSGVYFLRMADNNGIVITKKFEKR